MRRNRPFFSNLHIILYGFIALINLRSVFLFLGNPGFPTFYVPFAKALYSLTNRRFPVWIISHAGHAMAPKEKKILTTSEGMSLLTSTFLYSEWMFTFLESLLRLRVTSVETSACGIRYMVPYFGNFKVFRNILTLLQVIFYRIWVDQTIFDLPSLFTN